MSDPQQLDRELKEYLEKEPNLKREDRLNYLRALMNKHLEFNKLEHVVTSQDFYEIVSGAKNNYSNARLPVKITKRQMDGNELTHIAMIESFIGYLNRMHLTKKTVKFDYTD
jgi:hypothetical protein